jgi:hypothetical protein
MAVVIHAVSQSTDDIEDTIQFASDRLTAVAAAVATATTAALGATGAAQYELLLELEIEMHRVESTLVTLREFTTELRHRLSP